MGNHHQHHYYLTPFPFNVVVNSIMIKYHSDLFVITIFDFHHCHHHHHNHPFLLRIWNWLMSSQQLQSPFISLRFTSSIFVEIYYYSGTKNTRCVEILLHFFLFVEIGAHDIVTFHIQNCRVWWWDHLAKLETINIKIG